MMKSLLLVFLSILGTMCTQAQRSFVYVPIGDSYTIGQGLPLRENFPSQLVHGLEKKHISVELPFNPARTGWTTADALKLELPLFEKAKPDFATLAIGVNDWVQGVSAYDYRRRLGLLMDGMLEVLPSKDRLIVLTIPDFSKVPAGSLYGQGRDISAGLAEFNAILIEEAEKRDLVAIDVFDLSQLAGKDQTLVAGDGLHYSQKGYAAWVERLLPAAISALKN